MTKLIYELETCRIVVMQGEAPAEPRRTRRSALQQTILVWRAVRRHRQIAPGFGWRNRRSQTGATLGSDLGVARSASVYSVGSVGSL
jgi:hypothetical protein